MADRNRLFSIDDLPSHLILEILTSGKRLSAVDLVSLELTSRTFGGSQGVYPTKFRSLVDLAAFQLCTTNGIYVGMSWNSQREVFERCGRNWKRVLRFLKGLAFALWTLVACFFLFQTHPIRRSKYQRNPKPQKMASLATHLFACLFFVPIGVRRLLCSSSIFLKNPSFFISKPWYFSNPKWKNFDLYVLAIVLPLASFSQIFIFLSISGHSTYHFSFFQQAVNLFLFWVLIIFFVLYDSLDHFLFKESFIFVCAAIAFLVEYSVIGAGITGLGTVVYDLLAQLTLLCAGSCLVLSVKPTAFFAEFLLSIGLVFKGTWLLQAGFVLYTDAFVLKGCKKMVVLPGSPNADVHCELEEDSIRGVALVNLLFVLHAIGIIIASLVAFGLLSSFKNLRCGEARGPLLAELESESILMRPTHELEME